MNSSYSTDMHASNKWHIILLQLMWWIMSAAGFVTIGILDPRNPCPFRLFPLFAIVWMIIGLSVSGALLFGASRLAVLSWRPIKQAIAAFIGFILGTVAFCFLYFSFEKILLKKDLMAVFELGPFIYIFFNVALWMAAAIAVGQVYRVQFTKREALRAYAERAETELRFVRQQVKSHLVFNALNSIMVAIEEKSPQAASMVLDLSRLLRQSLKTMPYMGTLGDELKRVQLYTRIEKSRFEDDLKISFDVADELLSLPSLPMVLQPLIENAIKHGRAQFNSPLHVDVRAERGDDRLTIRVTNQGQLACVEALRARKVNRFDINRGIGLYTVRRRLELEYGDEALLELTETTACGEKRVTATIGWPVEEHESTLDQGVMS
jgi:two-component system, LytTR family, sensor kinase